MKNYKNLLVERDGALMKITLNRPEDANSIDVPLAKELMEAAIDCDKDDTVRAVLLTATGRMFCAGGDLASFRIAESGIRGVLKEVTAYLHAANARFARMNAPLIIAVNGIAAGAGFSLAISGDIVVAAKSAKFTMAYTGIGATPDGGGSALLAKLTGLRRAQELIFTNRVLSADEALEWGLLTRVVADDELMREAESLAQTLANGPTIAYGKIKELLLSSYHTPLEAQLDAESRSIAHCVSRADGAEGLSAFADKRKPHFNGQ